MSHRVKQPAADPDPQVAQVIDDVNAVAGEFGKPAPYFALNDLHYDALAAAVWPRAQHAAASSHRAMADDKYGLVPEDHLAIIVSASILRGIAYGLELAKRRAQ